MSTVIDWSAKPEPWRSIGLRFCRDLGLDVSDPVVGTIKQRRKALGISGEQLGLAAGYTRRSGGTTVSVAEKGHAGKRIVGRLVAALDRLEAERQP